MTNGSDNQSSVGGNAIAEAYAIRMMTGGASNPGNPLGDLLGNPFGTNPASGSGQASASPTAAGYAGSGTQQAAAAAPQRQPLTRAQKVRRTVLTAVGAGVFLAYLGYDNNNFLRMVDGIPLVKDVVQPITKPRVAALGDSKGLAFSEQDYPYVVASKTTCLHTLANAKAKTDVCFDRDHKVFGALLQPPQNAEDRRPAWLAVQVRRDGEILGEPYYLPLRDLKAEPVTEPKVPAATAADYEVFLKKQPAKPAAAPRRAASAPSKAPGG